MTLTGQTKILAWISVCCLASTLSLTAHATVTLSSATTPSSGQPGVTTVFVIGSDFPSGTITPASVTALLQPASGSGPQVSTAATSVTTVSGTIRRVGFLVPSG